MGQRLWSIRQEGTADPVRRPAAGDRASEGQARARELQDPVARRLRARDRGQRDADRCRGRVARRNGYLLADRGRGLRERGLRVKIWGARGSVPSPGPETVRYGGNTSSVTCTHDVFP